MGYAWCPTLLILPMPSEGAGLSIISVIIMLLPQIGSLESNTFKYNTKAKLVVNLSLRHQLSSMRNVASFSFPFGICIFLFRIASCTVMSKSFTCNLRVLYVSMTIKRLMRRKSLSNTSLHPRPSELSQNITYALLVQNDLTRRCEHFDSFNKNVDITKSE